MHQIDTAFSTPAPEKCDNDLGCPTPPIAESKTEVEAPKNACILMMIKAYLAYSEFPARFYSGFHSATDPQLNSARLCYTTRMSFQPKGKILRVRTPSGSKDLSFHSK
uniref:Uncharacterized protein n=1 Tax=Candidatus Kentrum sp. LFY TaxID=2126342 RepID=A0A450UBG3_9GAMM|nr:MAG: hypothetical protein BECKLFY1418A_GA0070994_100821 [Candidatus Kentron sp. LFY]